MLQGGAATSGAALNLAEQQPTLHGSVAVQPPPLLGCCCGRTTGTGCWQRGARFTPAGPR